MRVQIVSSFGVPGCTPFAIGEEIEVTNTVAKHWIDAGRAVALEPFTEPVPEPATKAVHRELATAKPKRKQTR